MNNKEVPKPNYWPKTQLASDFTGWLLQGLITEEEKARLEKNKKISQEERGIKDKVS